MRFVLNTNYPDTPASKVCIGQFGSYLEKYGYSVTYNDWDHYEKYDVVVFMPYDCELEKARAQNPSILVGLGDPKPSDFAKRAALFDFLMVSSLEQQDLFCQVNPNAFVYYMFPQMAQIPKETVQRDTLVIGYHGNKTHLNSLAPNITTALEALGRERQVEFWAMYNFENLGKWRMGLPDPALVKTRHIPWSPEGYRLELSKVDIGIVPNAILPGLYDRGRKAASALLSKVFNLTESDLLIRYKFSSNPGRIYVFSQLGIPVVADFFPSACQTIEHGKSGFLAHSAQGWYNAFKALGDSAELREKTAQKLRERFEGALHPEETFRKFIQFLVQLKTEGPQRGRIPQCANVEKLSVLRIWFQTLREYFLYFNRFGRSLRLLRRRLQLFKKVPASF